MKYNHVCLHSPPQLPPYIPLTNLSLYNSPLSPVSVHISMGMGSSTGARETYVSTYSEKKDFPSPTKCQHVLSKGWSLEIT